MKNQEIQFDIDPTLILKGLRGVYLVIHGIKNQESDPNFEEYKDREITRLFEEYSKNKLENDPILKGYRDLHTAFGFSNRNFPAAPETLAENLLKYKRLAKVNLLVDIYNLVSLQTRLALGAHDLKFVSGDIHLKPMTGEESFLPLGAVEPKPVRAGGYSYIDDGNNVICMLDSRQVEKTKITLSSTDVFYIIQGNSATNYDILSQGALKLVDLTKRFCGGQEVYLKSL